MVKEERIIAKVINTMGRSPCCDENGLKKGPWTPEEDQKLVQHIQKHGHGSWRALPKLAGLNRCGKSCRLRWTNYLRPDIKRGKFSQEEEQTILHLHSILGNKWSAIATHLPGRTDNEIKNFWNTHLKKKLIQMGFDPMTHQPRTDLISTLPYLLALANMTELMDHHSWDEQAVQLAKLQYLHQLLQSSSNILNINNSGYDQNALTNIEPFTLLNTISSNNVKESQGIDSSSQLDTTELGSIFSDGIVGSDHQSSQLLHHQSMVLPQLLDPQQKHVSFTSSQSCLNNEQGQQGTTNFAMISQGADDDMSWINIIPSIPTNEIGTSVNNPGDASSSTCSYGGVGEPSSSWSELLFDDPIYLA